MDWEMPRRKKGIRLWLRERKGREAVYVIIDGKNEISTGFGAENVEGANQALADYLASHFKPDTSERRLDRIPVAEVLSMYQSLIPADSPSRATIGYNCAALLTFWGNKTLADVKASTCKSYVEFRGVKPGTARLELKKLQAAINVWHRESALPAVPQVTLPRPAPPKERVLERAEVAAMLRACRLKRGPVGLPQIDCRHIARVIRLGIATGTRISAMLALSWVPSIKGGWIDTERGILYRRGRGEAETSKRRPPMVLTGKTLAMVRRWQAQDERKGVSRVISFRGVAIAEVDNGWHSVVRLAGLGKDVTPHTLKHTAITWALWAGAQPWELSGIFGTDAATIERVYGHHRKINEGKRA
jgi:integrase